MPSHADHATPMQDQAEPMPVPTQDGVPSGLIDIAEAAAQANRSVDQIRRLIRDGRLTQAKKVHTPVGKKWFIDPAELATYYGCLCTAPGRPVHEPMHGTMQDVEPIPEPADAIEEAVSLQMPGRDYPQMERSRADATEPSFFSYLHAENIQLKEELKEQRDRVASLTDERAKLEAELGGQRARAEEREKMVMWLQEQFPELIQRVALTAGKSSDPVVRPDEGIASTLRPEGEIRIEPVQGQASAVRQEMQPRSAVSTIAAFVIVLVLLGWLAYLKHLI